METPSAVARRQKCPNEFRATTNSADLVRRAADQGAKPQRYPAASHRLGVFAPLRLCVSAVPFSIRCRPVRLRRIVGKPAVRRSRLLTLALLLGVLLASLDANAQAPPPAELATPRNDIPALSNFAKVSDALYRGAQPTAEGFAKLKEMGVKTVVNLRGFHSDRGLMKGLGLNYVHISFKPWHAEDEDVIPFLKLVLNPKNQPVFVHCLHGADRTGTMVAIYRVCGQGWKMDKAMEELPRFGFHTVWENLRRYLLALDPEALKAKAASAPDPKAERVP
ncbi:MAG: hypothetical protein FJ279_11845 [Planctomycetes bacterium]|nr:hypothetical protein [Planctomycetota bacterium]MBM4080484.1 hypothetical protein [Planctomycetota bacterium]